jgi:uncharacterized protein (TIGR00661 family)
MLKILYAVQGTGNGHITRAIELIPCFKKHGEVDVLVSGIQSDIELPFKVTYRFKGLSFIFGKKGGVDIWKTYQKMNTVNLFKEIKQLPVKKYDLIISDFEPVSSWACLKAKINCIGLSNQAATLHPLAPKPKKTDVIGKLVLVKYAPCNYQYGFHFKSLDQNVFTPIIRKELREAKTTSEGHYTVYLPAYDNERIIKYLSVFKQVKWQVFSKHTTKKIKKKNINIYPIENKLFLKSLLSCEGVLCNSGFGTTSEALFLHKKLLVIPMKKQYEQYCNAAMLKSMGVPVMKKLNSENTSVLKEWLQTDNRVEVDYKDNAQEIADLIVKNHATSKHVNTTHESQHYSIFQ